MNWPFIFLPILFSLKFEFVFTISCSACDETTTQKLQSGTSCSFQIYDFNPILSSTCTCQNSSFALIYRNETGMVSCYNPNDDTCTDVNPEDGICDSDQNVRCTTTVLTISQKNIAEYMLYFITAWIILWCSITIAVNFMHKNSGHHRFIHLYEEIIIIILLIVIGVANVTFVSKKSICKYIPILSQFFMALLNAASVMESIFAKSMVHARSKKNGFLPAVLNYLIPIPLALLPTLLTYFSLKQHYGSSYQFCFTIAPGDMFWAFVIPNWILIAVAGLQAQLSCLACDQTIPEQDQVQCYWAKKSAKSLLLFSLLIFTLWFMILSAGNEQITYLFIIAILLAIIAGPVIFVVHTFCHLNTCQKWSKPGFFGGFYQLCLEKPKDKPKDPLDDDDDDLAPQEPSPTTQNAPPPFPNKVAPLPEILEPPKSTHNEPTHTPATQFYSWLTAPDMFTRRPSSVLFRPKPS